MGAGRPVSGDDPAKYAEAYDLFRLTESSAASGQTAIVEIAAFLTWAISTRQSRFVAGERIVVGALAKGVERSRNTAAGALGHLVALGMVVQDKPKSPYRIVSDQAIFTDAAQVADEQPAMAAGDWGTTSRKGVPN